MEQQPEECLELKSIKYKSMLLSGAPVQETKPTDNMFDLDHEMYKTKFQSFDNIKIMNGKIMQAQVHKILNAHQTNTRAL